MVCSRQLHKERSYEVLVVIDLLLVLLYKLEVFIVVSVKEHIRCSVETVESLTHHLGHGVARLGYGDRRCRHETFVELEFRLFVGFLNHYVGKLHELLSEREQKDRVADIKDRVERRDADNARRLIHEREVHDSIKRIEDDKPEYGTYDLDGHMYGGNSLSISVNTDG